MGIDIRVATSICIDSTIQIQICCQPINIIGWKIFNGGTFSNKDAHKCICVVCKYYKTHVNFLKNHDLSYERPWPMSTCERP